jgi:hypothetical protein
MPDGLYIVTTKHFVAGFVVESGLVTRCAPILRKRLEHWIDIAQCVEVVIPR